MKSRKLPSTDRQTIVVLDDEENALMFFKQILEEAFSDCNLKFYTEPSKDFFNFIDNNHVDVFIMDIRLGNEKDGLQISQELICNKRGSIFLFVSGYEYDTDSFCHLCGKCVYDFLSKPIDLQEFVIVVSTLLNIASSYKISFKNTRIKPRESQLDELRKGYLKLIEEDRILINRLKQLT